MIKTDPLRIAKSFLVSIFEVATIEPSQLSLDSFAIPHIFYLLEEKFNYPFEFSEQPKTVGELSELVKLSPIELNKELVELRDQCSQLVCGADNLPQGPVLDLRSAQERSGQEKTRRFL